MPRSFQILKNLLLNAHVVEAHVPLTAEVFARKIKERWNRRTVPIGDDLALKFRAIAKIAGRPDYVLKFTFVHEAAEVPDLEYCLSTTYDTDMGVYCAYKIRSVSKAHEYKSTSRDDQFIISFDPETVVDDLVEKFHDRQNPMNQVAHRLFKQGIVHLGERHPELDRHIEEPKPFDYAQEMLRVLKAKGEIDLQGKAKIKAKTTTALKNNEDVVLKMDLKSEGLPEGTELNLYLTLDDLFDSVAVRKIRIRNKKHNDYSDSDNDHVLTLDKDPATSAHELIEQLQNGDLSEVVFDMIMRAEHHLGGTAEDESLF